MRFNHGIWNRAALPAALAFAGFVFAGFVFAVSAFAVSAFADIYSWTDKNGVKHFSSDPPPRGEPVTDLRVMKTTPEPEEPETADTGKPAADTTSAEAPKNAPKVDIYVDAKSELCKAALAFFERNKIACTKHDIDADPQALQRYRSLEGRGVPIVFIGDNRMDGWDEETAKEYLGIK